MTLLINSHVPLGGFMPSTNQPATSVMPPDVEMQVDDELRAVREDGDDDIEMEEESDIDLGSFVCSQGTQGYLTIDTNVLISHLEKVQRLYEVLYSPKYHGSVSLLIPITVINELDKLKTVTYRPDNPYPRYSGKVTVAARQATEWLLSAQQQCREMGKGAIRFQKWSERIDKFLRKADDKIVDCIMYFQRTGAGYVKLWTGDKNLAIVAGSQNITVIPSPPPPLSEVLQMFGLPSLVIVAGKRTVPVIDHKDIHAVIVDDEGMDIDKPLYSPLPSLSETSGTASPIAPNTPRISTIATRPTSALKRPPSTTLLPSTIPTPEILYRLTDLSNLIFAALPTPPPSSTLTRPPISTSDPTRLSTQRSLTHLVDTLNLLSPPDNHLPASQDIARLIAVLIDLSKWVGPTSGLMGGKGRRPLDSEATAALEVIVDVLPKLGVVLEGIEAWSEETIEMIRAL